jgi:hypothetical protein
VTALFNSPEQLPTEFNLTMPADILESFVDQIASWARQAVDQGRSPFRKVETALPLLTRQGEILAPLVFWINRDSFMAGGLMLFPRQGCTSSLDQGVCLAEALGLQHFVEWTECQINIWQIRERQATLECSFPLGKTSNQVAAFRQLLGSTLDKLKYLSVLASIAPEQQSASYLANLCRTAIYDTLPLLEAEQRIAQGKGISRADNWPLGKGYLTVTRLLALTSLDLLPTSVQPEGLEKAILFALPEIPDALRTRLQFAENGIPLPCDAAVRFHHLLRRLQQLGMRSTFQRTCTSLELLLAQDGGLLTGPALPEIESGQARAPTLSVNSTAAPTNVPDTIEIAPPPLLAIKSLIRHLEGWKQPELQSHDLFTLHLPQLPVDTHGLLFRQERPERTQRPYYEAALRISWPSRRFPLPHQTPVWMFECLHLLGLCQPDGTLRLKMPALWLEADWGELLWGILCQEFTLSRLTRDSGNWTTLHLIRNNQLNIETELRGEANGHCDWHELRNRPRPHLHGRLSLPGAWLTLLDTGVLRTYPATDLPGRFPRAIEFFYRQQPGSNLGARFGLQAERLSTTQLLQNVAELGVPAPNEQRLERLEGMLTNSLPPDTEDPAVVAERLSWLGSEFQQLSLLQTKQAGPQNADQKPSRVPQNLPGEIAGEIFRDGIPAFPEHYLYDYYRPELQTFNWQGDLHYGQSFFGRIILQDSSGTQLEIDGEPRAAGLWLAAMLNRSPVDFPIDAKICESILIRYLQDLQRLRRALEKRTRERLENPKQAENLIRKLWQDQKLPGWEMVERVMTLFPEQFSVR